MSKDFPLSVDMLLNVLEVIAPFKHFSKLREFVTLKLPSGFPVKIDIPILPTVSAKITFQKFEFRDDISPDLFVIPGDYKEDSMRFPDLWPFDFEQLSCGTQESRNPTSSSSSLAVISMPLVNLEPVVFGNETSVVDSNIIIIIIITVIIITQKQKVYRNPYHFQLHIFVIWRPKYQQ